MECQEAAYRLQELSDEALPAETARQVRAHSAACAACGRVSRGLAVVTRALSGLPVYSLAPEARARILAAWAAHRRTAAGRMWTSAALLAMAGSGLAMALWLVDSGLNLTNAQAALNLVLDPEGAQLALRLKLMPWFVTAGQWLCAAKTWVGPAALGFKGGALMTLVLFTIMVSGFFVIELHSRLRSVPRLGDYL